jgi:hypothetical protein
MGAKLLGGIGMTVAAIGWTADPHERTRPEGRHTRLASILAAVAAGNETRPAATKLIRYRRQPTPPTGPYRGI